MQGGWNMVNMVELMPNAIFSQQNSLYVLEENSVFT